MVKGVSLKHLEVVSSVIAQQNILLIIPVLAVYCNPKNVLSPGVLHTAASTELYRTISIWWISREGSDLFYLKFRVFFFFWFPQQPTKVFLNSLIHEGLKQAQTLL